MKTMTEISDITFVFMRGVKLEGQEENYMMNDNIWHEGPRKSSTGPLADTEIFDRSKG